VRGMVGQWARLEEVDAEHCQLRMRVENLDWPASALGMIGADFTVVQPPELIERLRNWGARFARATRASDSNG